VKSKTQLVPPDDVRRRYAEVLPQTQVLALETLFRLRSRAQSVDTVLSQWLGSDAVTPGRLQVLAVLWSRQQPLPQREIVKTLKVSRATVSELVETLTREGHVFVKPSDIDHRLIMVELTKTGARFTERLIRENAKRLRKVFCALQDAELKQLIALLDRLL